MILLLLLFVIVLVGLALHFMQEAVTHQEFSLMLAGTLMAASAAGLVGVYLVAGNYMGYMSRSHNQAAIEQAYDSIRGYVEVEDASELQIFVSDAVK
jgi:hypothetical protein